MSLLNLAMLFSTSSYIWSITVLKFSNCVSILIYWLINVSYLSLFLLNDFCPHYGCISLFSFIPGNFGLDARYGEFCLVKGQMFLCSTKNSWVFSWDADKLLGNSLFLLKLAFQLCQVGPEQPKVYFFPHPWGNTLLSTAPDAPWIMRCFPSGW